MESTSQSKTEDYLISNQRDVDGPEGFGIDGDGDRAEQDSIRSRRDSSDTTSSSINDDTLSRTPLFDDDEEDEEEQEILTPTSSSSYRSVSPFRRRKSHLPSKPTATDPLISPPLDEAPTAAYFSSPPRSPASPPLSSSTPAKVFSLLAASLAKLPNLSLNRLPRLPIKKMNWETQYESRGRSSVSSSMRGSDLYSDSLESLDTLKEGRGRREIKDWEATAFVELQIFSPPPSPRARSRSPSPSRDTDPLLLPPLIVITGGKDKEKENEMRFISNPRHLLMLALEFEMINRGKITGPLRPRAVVVRLDGRTCAATENGVRAIAESRLRWEL